MFAKNADPEILSLMKAVQRGVIVGERATFIVDNAVNEVRQFFDLSGHPDPVLDGLIEVLRESQGIEFRPD